VPPTPTAIPTLKPIGGAAKERLISIGYNVPRTGTLTEVNQEFVGGVNLDPGYKERFLEIQNSLNGVLGGYSNYIYLAFDPTGTEEDAKPLFDRLEEVQYKPGVLWTIEELNKYLSCLSGSDPGGRRTPTTNPYSICLESLAKIYAYRKEPGPPTATNYAKLALHYAHEYFHHYQKVHGLERGLSHTYFNSESPESTVQAPPWWIEGAAVAFQNAWYKSNWQTLSFLEGEPYENDVDASTTDVNVSIGDIATAKAYKNARQMVKGTLPENELRGGCTADWSMTVIEEERSTWTGCDAAIMAVSYLAYLTSWKTVWIDIPQDYYDLGFWGAFEKHVGMTNQEFYDAFNKFLRSGDIDDDPPEGWTFPEGPISAYADFWEIVPESD
jgi:hypothetical protein